MKTILLTMLITVFGAAAVHSQSTDDAKSSDCDKKILKKIKRKMALVDFEEYVALDQQATFIVTCVVKEDKTISIINVRGRNEKLNEAIIEKLEEDPVKCDWVEPGIQFSFLLTFKHLVQ